MLVPLLAADVRLVYLYLYLYLYRPGEPVTRHGQRLADSVCHVPSGLLGYAQVTV